MLRMALTVVAASVALAASPVVAQPQEDEGEPPPGSGEDDQARGLFMAARAAYDGGRYDEALDYFQRAYELSGRPGFLYNIGATAERLRRDQEALDAFEQYLRDVPDAPNRVQVESRIALLREAIASGQQVEGQAPPIEVEPDPAPLPERGPGAGPWVLVGAGAAVAATGAVLLVLAGGAKSDVEGAPVGSVWTDFSDDYDTARTFGTLGLILLPVGVVAAGVGLAWLVAGSGDVEQPVTATVGPSGVAVRGSF